MRRLRRGCMLLGAAILWTSCGTVQEHRMRQYRREVATFSEPLRWKLAHGVVDQGFSSLMVYIALGQPWEKQRTGEHRETWLYIARPLVLSDPLGNAVTGWKTNADFVWGGFEPLGELSVILSDGQVSQLSYRAPPDE